MIKILNGNDIASSRNAFFDLKTKAKNTSLLNGNGLTYDVLFQTLENKSMFDDGFTVFIENFFLKNKSTSDEFKKIAEYLLKNKNAQVVFWEADEISKSALSAFKTADIQTFTIPQVLFQFLDNMKPDNLKYLITLFHSLQKSTETEIILFMMIRQFRIMLGISDINADSIDEVKRLAPWQSSKLKAQTGYFKKEELIKIYQKIFELDLNQKTGKSSVNLSSAIDFFLLDL